MDTNVLYERMKALQAKEAGENNAIVEAAIEKDQAIVAGIRGDAAERPTPERTCATTRTFTRVVLHETRENIFINRASEPRKSTHQFLKKILTRSFSKKKISSVLCTSTIVPRSSRARAAGAFDALIEHILSTPMEAMDFEGVRCAPLLTKAFSAHIDLRAREAAARGDEAGDDAVAELTLLASWVSEQRERQEERDDAARRRQRQQTGGGGGTDAAVASNDESVSFPTPLRTAGDKFASLMAAAANGVDALRAEIVRMAEAREVDDALMAILTGNAANAEAEGDDGRAKFLYKIAEVCLREKANAGGDA